MMVKRGYRGDGAAGVEKERKGKGEGVGEGVGRTMREPLSKYSRTSQNSKIWDLGLLCSGAASPSDTRDFLALYRLS